MVPWNVQHGPPIMDVPRINMTVRIKTGGVNRDYHGEHGRRCMDCGSRCLNLFGQTRISESNISKGVEMELLQYEQVAMTLPATYGIRFPRAWGELSAAS